MESLDKKTVTDRRQEIVERRDGEKAQIMII